MKHFYYQRKQRRSALTLLLNVAVLLTMWLAAHQYLTPAKFGSQAEEVLFWINLVAPIICALLLACACWFWLSNKSFEIELTDTKLKVTDPLFSDFTWELPLKSIAEIRHQYDIHIKHTSIKVITKSAETYQLTQNYHFNRKKLYAAINKIAPHIVLPENAYRFTKPAR